ncbi:MAG: hypothetical protein QOG83_441 [Alphaproteobacteria bacterium]|jgi:ABC-type maltose transport system permease subunit|nr:hypothetical protein [Alphaproteobacteria bacterium]
MSKLAKMVAETGDVDYPTDTCAVVNSRARWRALPLALIATAFWYVLWFTFSLSISAWAGLAIFVVALILGYAFARTILQQSVAEEIQRRRALLKTVENYRKQRESTQ